MRTIKLPVSWEMFGIVEVEANSIEEAIEYFDKNIDQIPLPYGGGDYVDGSFDLVESDEEYIELFNPDLDVN